MSLWITKHCHAQQLNMLLPHVEETSLNADISITLLCSAVHLPGIVLLLVCCVGLPPLLWGQKMLYVLSAVMIRCLHSCPLLGCTCIYQKLLYVLMSDCVPWQQSQLPSTLASDGGGLVFFHDSQM